MLRFIKCGKEKIDYHIKVSIVILNIQMILNDMLQKLVFMQIQTTKHYLFLFTNLFIKIHV